MVVATGITVRVTWSVGPVSSCATIRAVPRALPATTVPEAADGTAAIEGSSVFQTIGVFGIGDAVLIDGDGREDERRRR